MICPVPLKRQVPPTPLFCFQPALSAPHSLQKRWLSPPLLPLPSFLSFHNLLNKLYRDSLCMACGSVSFPHQLQLLEGPATPLTNPPPKVSHPPPPTRLGLTEAWGGGTQVPSWPTAASQELQRFTETITIMRTLVIKA